MAWRRLRLSIPPVHGLVQAPEWSPRLVVDSSVSAVTENTRRIVGLNFGPRTRDFCVSIIGAASINASHVISGPELRAITGLVLHNCLCRQLRKIIFVSHGFLIYVDALLCLLRKCACPMLAALVVILLLALSVPMSWRKASLSSTPLWTVGRLI